MAYVAETDVEGELSYAITISTQPTTVEVAIFIAEIEAKVNGVLDAIGISRDLDSVANAICYNIVKQISLWGVCSRVIAASGGLVLNQAGKEEAYWERFERELAAIHDNPALLSTDAPFSSSSARLGVAGLTDDDDEAHDRIFALDDEY